MKVKEIMSCDVKKIDCDAMISEAAEKMKTVDVGILPVEKEGKIVGMITDRDIVLRVIAEYMDPGTTMVSEAMTDDVICCSEEEDVGEAARLMEDKQVRRLLVLRSDNTVAGILSVSDFALKTTDEHLTCEVLERICAPTHTS